MLAIPVDSIVGGVMTGVRAEEKKNMRRQPFFSWSRLSSIFFGGEGGLGGFCWSRLFVRWFGHKDPMLSTTCIQ